MSEAKLNKLKAIVEKAGIVVHGTCDEYHDQEESFRGLWISLEDGLMAEIDIFSDSWETSRINCEIEKLGYYLEPQDGGTGILIED